MTFTLSSRLSLIWKLHLPNKPGWDDIKGCQGNLAAFFIAR